jgi:hypothetical protein
MNRRIEIWPMNQEDEHSIFFLSIDSMADSQGLSLMKAKTGRASVDGAKGDWYRVCGTFKLLASLSSLIKGLHIFMKILGFLSILARCKSLNLAASPDVVVSSIHLTHSLNSLLSRLRLSH